jgi:putative endonuclease
MWASPMTSFAASTSIGKGSPRGFTKKYGVKMLVYFEEHGSIIAAIQCEKNIKHWSREWKIDLIRSMKPEWHDRYDDIVR